MLACPYCQGDATQELDRVTALGYRLYRCRPCRRTFNERTGTPFNRKRQDSERSWAVVRVSLRWPLPDGIYAACSSARTAPHCSWNRRRCSAKETVSFICWRQRK